MLVHTIRRFFVQLLEKTAPRVLGSSLKYAIVFPPSHAPRRAKTFWRSLNRHNAVGHRQILPHRVPGVLRLLQPDVLDHLSPHQRRGRGRPRAARGGEVNGDVAALRVETEKGGQKCARNRALARKNEAGADTRGKRGREETEAWRTLDDHFEGRSGKGKQGQPCRLADWRGCARNVRLGSISSGERGNYFGQTAGK